MLPKSHFKKQDACAFAEKYGWEHPDIITVEMEPGDVLLHDVMVYHGSPPTAGGPLRRTLYYEFRSVEWNRDAGIWSEEWVNRRIKHSSGTWIPSIDRLNTPVPRRTCASSTGPMSRAPTAAPPARTRTDCYPMSRAFRPGCLADNRA